MTGPSARAGRVFAVVSTALLVSASVIVLSATFVGERLIALQTAQAETVTPQLLAPVIDRHSKGDALFVATASENRVENLSVDIVLEIDPSANVTVAKKINLPNANKGRTAIEHAPEDSKALTAPPHGCESAFARPAPESLTRKLSRCVTGIPSSIKIAHR